MSSSVKSGNTAISGRLPAWLKKRGALSDNVHQMKRRLRRHGLHTVCEEARCPNIGECFARGTATIMILGDRCTRRCNFCAVAHGQAEVPDPAEPRRVAEEIRELALRHAVVTSVTRDDLPDGGAAHFAATIQAIRQRCPATTIEVLTPDFEGREADIRTVCASGPDVFNHNVETVERLTPTVRSRASYRRSLEVLRVARKALPPSSPPYTGGGRVKSGLMVGLGESAGEVEATLRDLREAGCDIVTIGQYLPPSKAALPVAEYVDPETFRAYEKMGFTLGIKYMFCGPFVRSSYLADQGLV